VKLHTSIKHFALAFLLAALCYWVLNQNIDQRRHRKGPWQILFTTNPNNNAPLLVINQPKLAITNVEINFVDEVTLLTNPVKMTFRQAEPVPYPVPFGQCTAMDTRFLPGTVAFQLFGHTIELRPRALIIDRQEHPWSSERFNLPPIRRPEPPPPR
jgi:hypothetical protein